MELKDLLKVYFILALAGAMYRVYSSVYVSAFSVLRVVYSLFQIAVLIFILLFKNIVTKEHCSFLLLRMEINVVKSV